MTKADIGLLVLGFVGRQLYAFMPAEERGRIWRIGHGCFSGLLIGGFIKMIYAFCIGSL